VISPRYEPVDLDGIEQRKPVIGARSFWTREERGKTRIRRFRVRIESNRPSLE
jgi:hypothetical protein